MVYLNDGTVAFREKIGRMEKSRWEYAQYVSMILPQI